MKYGRNAAGGESRRGIEIRGRKVQGEVNPGYPDSWWLCHWKGEGNSREVASGSLKLNGLLLGDHKTGTVCKEAVQVVIWDEGAGSVPEL